MAFKVGDVLIGVDEPISNHADWWVKGERVTVTKVLEGNRINRIYVRNQRGNVSGPWRDDRFTSAAEKPAFKPGDVVICVDSTNIAFLNKGQEYIVHSYDPAYWPLRGGALRVTNKPATNFCADRFKLVPKKAFKKGDRVVCVKPFGDRLLRDRVYVIDGTNGGKSGKAVHVEGDAGWWITTRFEHAAAVVPPELWKLGDEVKVKCLDNHSVPEMEKYIGQVGKIRHNEILHYSGVREVTLSFEDGHSWYWLPTSLIHESEWKGTKRAAVVPPPPPKPPFREELQERVKKNGGSGLCSFGYVTANGNKEFKVANPCHAAINHHGYHGKVVEFVYNLYHDMLRAKSVKPGERREKHLAYVHYILNESPWAECFITKDVKEAEEQGILMNVNVKANRFAAACVALREGQEYADNVLTTFTYFKSKGFSGNVAYALSRAIIVRVDGTFATAHFDNAHAVLSNRCSWEHLVKFFHSGYHLDEAAMKPYCEVGTYRITDYIAKRDEYPYGRVKIFEDFIGANLKTEIVGEGFNARTILTENSVLAFAALVEKHFKEGKV